MASQSSFTVNGNEFSISFSVIPTILDSQDMFLCNFSPYTFFSLFPVETIVICYEAVRLYSKCGAQVDLILLLNMHDGKGDCPGYWILAHG